jgi:iron complex outermembrane receptor protein
MRSFFYRLAVFTAAFVTITIVGLILAAPVLSQEAADPAGGPVHEAPEVVVTAGRYDEATGLNLSNITREELDLRAPDQELPLLLNGLPGVFAFSDAGSGLGYSYIKVRGFDQRRVGVLFEGIPLNDPEDHQIWWVDMPDLAASVQDIQVQRGVTNSVGGMTAIGGTVNIAARRLGADPRGRVSLNAGSYGFQRQMVEYETGDLGGGLRSSFRLSRQEADGYRERSGHDGWGVFWTGQWRTERSTTKALIWTGREVTQHAWDAVPESVLRENRRANVETYHNAVDDFRQPHYLLANTFHLDDAWTLDNRLYAIQGEGFYENFKEDADATAYSLDRLAGIDPGDGVDLIRRKHVRKDHVGWVPSLRWEQGPRGRLVLGGDWYTFHSRHWGDVMWADGFAPGDFLPGYKYHDYTGDKDAWSLYLNQRYEVLPGLTATADVHFQHKEYSFLQQDVKNFTGDLRNGYTVDWDFFNPKGALNWELPGQVAGGRARLYGSVGVNHREPTDGELFDTWQSGSDLGVQPLFGRSENRLDPDGSTAWVEWFDPLVKEERVVDYEVGLGWRSGRASVTVGGYWMDFRDEIVPYGGVGEDGSSIRGNADRTRHRGIELGVNLQVSDRDALALAGSRSWDEFVTFSEFLDTDWDGTADTVVDHAGNPIALFPEYLAMAAWDRDWRPGVRTRLRLNATGKQYLDNTGDEDRTIDAWTTVDVSLWLALGDLGLAPLDGATAFVHVRNLGDTAYEVWGYYYEPENWYTPAAGRNVALGLDYDF